ncbi:DNA methyltransferase [Halobium salinum]|uniref:Type II methyltransferase n=1 Tax=Halobium salinum TaxID=1364940 RepID=A0ABD5P7T7_9EURY|nr:site-specific DNA-methyltransferase [Halobium salinum]
MNTRYQSRDWLYREYYEKERTLQDIADELGVDHTTISKWRRKLDVPKPSRKIELTCPICDKDFIRSKGRVERAKHTSVCSRDCLHEARRQGLLSWKNRIVQGNSRELERIPDESIDLVVTSPPYHVDGFTEREDYPNYDDSQGIDQWESLMEDVLSELFRVTKPDAKICLIVGTSKALSGRTRQYRLSAHTYNLALNAGFDYFDGIIWSKNTYANSGGRSKPLFGSYPYPTNFLINQNHEQILVFRKWVSEDYYSQRDLPGQESEVKEESRLSVKEWREYAQSIWKIDPVKNGDHPAQFPEELVARLIRLYSFREDTVFDPFSGVGTTVVAAMKNGRQASGYELSSEYCEVARNRLDNLRTQF